VFTRHHTKHRRKCIQNTNEAGHDGEQALPDHSSAQKTKRHTRSRLTGLAVKVIKEQTEPSASAPEIPIRAL